MIQGKIVLHTHYFTVLAVEARFRILMQNYMTEFLIEKQLVKRRGRFRLEPTRFWWRRSLRNELRAFSINEYDAFMDYMKAHGLQDKDFEVKTAPVHAGVDVELKVSGFSPWEEQVPLIEFAKGESHQYAITLQPGGGKTLIALFLAAYFGKRFVVVTKGGYEGRWIPAFYDVLGLTPSEVRSCCGAKAIVKVIAEAKAHGIDDVKALFFSTSGLRDYIKRYEAGVYEGTVCEDVPPEKLYEFLGIGFRIVDEAHQEVHANYVADLYTNLNNTLYLTGTLIPQTDFIRGIYEKFLPLKVRKAADKFNVYAQAIEVFYRLNSPESARYIGPQGSYSHVVFEQWLMKDPERLKNWLTALYDFIVDSWAANRVEETKIIIFAATVEMNEHVYQYFKRRMPDLRVVHYKAGDPYEYLVDNDIITATLGKAGTAVDIPDLEQVHMTNAVDSANTSVQAFGRLRELKRFPDITPKFHWYTCLDVEKQVEYGKRKRTFLKPRVKRISIDYLSKNI